MKIKAVCLILLPLLLCGFRGSLTTNIPRGWNQIAIGAGGQLTGLDIANDGTLVTRTDVGGGYIYDTALGRNRQLMTALTMPGSAFTTPNTTSVNYQGGLWEVLLAHNNSSRIYMITSQGSVTPYGNLYRSDDGGHNFAATGLAQISGNGFDANSALKFIAQKAAVDPNNGDIIYIALFTGITVSFDGGATFNLISTGTIPAPASNWSGGLAFDPSGGTVTVGGQTRTKNIYLTSYGHGVYQSTDGGVTWTQIADGTSSLSPVNVKRAKVGADGAYWCSDDVNYWAYISGSWLKTQTPYLGGNVLSGLITDPNQAGRVIFTTVGVTTATETLDNGATFVHNPASNSSWFINFPAPGMTFTSSSDVKWLSTVPGVTAMTMGDAMIDPTTGHIKIAEGIGLWDIASWPQTFVAGIAFTAQSAGIEELVANDIVAPLGNNPIASFWDRAAFAITDPKTYPSKFGPISGSFNNGWALDYASNDPTFVCMRAYFAIKTPFDSSGFSTDGGANWTLFSGTPASEAQNGTIACASSTNMVQIAGTNKKLYNTKDGGATWNQPASVTQTNWITQLAPSYHIVAADRVNIGTFYAILNTGVSGATSNLWTSTDQGDTWTSQSASAIFAGGGFQQRLRASPAAAGDLWYTTSYSTGGGVTPANQFLMRSTDAGATWLAISKANGYGSDVKEVADFGFGAPKPGGSGYPSIYIAGWVDGVWGVWRSDDQAQTWVNLATYVGNSLDKIKVVNGDMNTWGICYVGMTGTGFWKGVTN